MIGVVDASVVVAALVDEGPAGRWAERVIGRGVHCAPALLPAEVSNALRRLEHGRRISAAEANAAHHDLMRLEVELFSFSPFADRTWALRHHVSSYDAWYVALAEALGLPLATVDARLAGARGPTCRFLTPHTPVQT